MAGDCIFCKMIKGEIEVNFVYKDELVVAIEDINPQAPVHTLIIPKKHIPTPLDIEGNDRDIMCRIFQVAKDTAKKKNIDKSGYRLVVNCNRGAGQTVFHLHFHLLGGREMGWPPG